MNIPGLLFLAASASAPAAPPAFTAEDEAAILLMEAMRLPPTAFSTYADSADPAGRARAARALGRLRSTEALAELGALAEDPDAAVRSEAYFALGQTPGAEGTLLTLLNLADSPAERALICAGLGKQGSAASVPVLVQRLGEEAPLLHPPVVAEAAAIALGRLSMRGVTEAGGEAVVMALVGQLRRLDLDARRGAAFALARIKPATLSTPATEALFAAASREGDLVSRVFLIRSTAAVAGAEAQKAALYGVALRDSSPRVRVAVARAGGAARWRGVVTLLDDPDPGVRREAIAAVGQIEALDRVGLLRPIVDRGDDQRAAEDLRTRGDPRLVEAAEALGALTGAGLIDQLGPYLGLDRPDLIREAAIAGLSEVPRLVTLATADESGRVRVAAATRLVELNAASAAYLPLLLAADPVVATAAADHLTAHPDRAAEPLLVRLLSKPFDPDLTKSAAAALAALYPEKKNQIGKQKVSPTLVKLVESLGANPDPEIVDAAAVLADAFKVPRPQAVHRPIHVPLDQLATIRGARVRTSRGEVLLRLFPAEAPITVWNFVRLAEDGYYDGLSIHRVVPDFVVQDGDPRGDGNGGPGWSIPDEINPLRYDEGMVGMALSGPDTGGSQWFVTLSPQPHLDGTYTIFGAVTDGLPLLRTMQPGDRIERITIERSAVAAP